MPVRQQLHKCSPHQDLPPFPHACLSMGLLYQAWGRAHCLELTGTAMGRRKSLPLRGVSRLLFCAAFTLISAKASFYSYFYSFDSYSFSSSWLDSVASPTCRGTVYFIGDGDCDDENNNEVCTLANAAKDFHGGA